MIKWLDENLEESLLVLLLGAMTLIMGMQVLSRYAFGYSLSWSEEVTRFLFIWSAFLSLSYCTKKCISIKIEQFLHKFSKKEQSMLKIINHSIELLFFTYMIPFSIMYLMASIDSGQVSPALGLPMYFIQSAPLASFSLSFFRILQRWIVEYNTVKISKERGI